MVPFYRSPALSCGSHAVALDKLKTKAGQCEIDGFDTELCFYVGLKDGKSKKTAK